MSLTDAERARCADELRAALDESEITEPQLLKSLGWSDDQLSSVLDMADDMDPADGWLLRDFLVQVARDFGNPVPHFSVLTHAARIKAAGWFRLKPVPATPPRPQQH